MKKLRKSDIKPVCFIQRLKRQLFSTGWVNIHVIPSWGRVLKFWIFPNQKTLNLPFGKKMFDICHFPIQFVKLIHLLIDMCSVNLYSLSTNLLLAIEGVKTVFCGPDIVVEDVVGCRAGDNARVRTLNIRFIAEYKYFCQLLSKCEITVRVWHRPSGAHWVSHSPTDNARM